MPSSAQRLSVIADSRPDRTATVTPAEASAFRPLPSWTWNTLVASPPGPKYSRPSVITPSTSKTISSTRASRSSRSRGNRRAAGTGRTTRIR